MRIGIIGQGASAIYLALLLKQDDKDNKYNITIFDHNKLPLKKIYATGNGRCNLANSVINENSYNDKFAYNIVKKNNYLKLSEFLESIGIKTRMIDNLMYPFSLSSKSICDYLILLCKEYKIKFINEINIKDYEVNNKNIKLITSDNRNYNFDYLIIATGGKSSSKFGSDGSFLKILKNHNYQISDIYPGLTPIKTINKTGIIENERFKCQASLYLDNSLKYKEIGEVLVKKDGLSGISIMNISSIISRNFKDYKKAYISLDLFPNIEINKLIEEFKFANSISKHNFLLGYFTKNVAEYIRKESNAKNLMSFSNSDINKIANLCKNLKFEYKEHYEFNDSQVSVGGLELSNFNNDLSSKIEENVYCMGEILNFDGLCGGYNLLLCYAEAKLIKDSLSKK